MMTTIWDHQGLSTRIRVHKLLPSLFSPSLILLSNWNHSNLTCPCGSNSLKKMLSSPSNDRNWLNSKLSHTVLVSRSGWCRLKIRKKSLRTFRWRHRYCSCKSNFWSYSSAWNQARNIKIRRVMEVKGKGEEVINPWPKECSQLISFRIIKPSTLQDRTNRTMIHLIVTNC